jgi:hypothetical protein
MRRLPAAITACSEADVAAEQRRMWNRYPRVSAAIWFGGAAAVSACIFMVVLGTGMVLFDVCAIAAAVLLGGLFGESIGRTAARSRWQAARRGSLIVFLSHYLAVLPVALIQSGSVGMGTTQLLIAIFIAPLITMLFSGVLTFPLGIAAAINLHDLRSKLPPGPLRLGCGGAEHLAVAELTDEGAAS